MLETKALPAIKKLYPNLNDCCVQDDEAPIHRTQYALETFDRCFPKRVPAKMASCTADILPIENNWSIVKDKLPNKLLSKIWKLPKKIITKVWIEISNDKALLKRIFVSSCNRMKAVIELDGAQVHKGDWSNTPQAAGDD